MQEIEFDVIVVGAGHAGCEAAAASARLSARTLLLTLSLDTVAQLSCNPAIGGIAKGHVVTEIDALGGLMSLVTDSTAIQYRLLNRSKGPAVRSPRAQCDRRLYSVRMRERIERQQNLTLLQGDVVGLLHRDGQVVGVRTAQGMSYRSKCVVLTAGTFLDGLIHVGELSRPGGRAGEPASVGLTEACEKLGIRSARLKTGTPPRIWGASVELRKLEEQKGDDEPCFFSRHTKQVALEQRNCYMARTNERTHKVLRDSFDRAPLFTGRIKSEGPRYCPSIELKLTRFADKDSHLLFLEPEGLDTDEYYLNGFATSVPVDSQYDAVRTIEGFENAVLSRPGYAIEYDYFEPTHLLPTLASAKEGALFFAGQVNGTSGYEEAAGQGLVAGTNAALRALGRDREFTLDRSKAYIGVLIDDLITKGVGEPYRLFTSRAEYRLLLRIDNVYSRLTAAATEVGLVGEDILAEQRAEDQRVSAALELLARRHHEGASLLQILRRPQTSILDIVELDDEFAALSLSGRELNRVEVEAKYEGYIKRQEAQVGKFRASEQLTLSPDIDYYAIGELSNESKEKLSRVRPNSIGQATRIPGITPADISVLIVRRKAASFKFLCDKSKREARPRKSEN